MRNTVKRIVALVLVFAMTFALTACYNENNLVAATKGDVEFPIGGYIYYLASAYNETQAEVYDDEDVLKATIDGENAKDHIKSMAMQSLNGFFYIEDKFNEYGLEITEDDLIDIESNTDYLWSYYRDTFEAMGVSKDSYAISGSEFNFKYYEVFQYMYGPNGDKALNDEDIREYYENTYFSYEYFSASTTFTNEEGETEDLSDEEKEEVKKSVEDYLTKVKAGEMDLAEAANDYMNLKALETSPYYKTEDKIEDASGDVQTAVLELGDNEYEIVETSSAIIIVKRLPISDAADEMLADEDARESMVSEMKADEFRDFVKEQADSVAGVTYNNSAINGVKWSSLVTDTTKKGTKERPEEEDDTSEVEVDSNNSEDEDDE